MNLAGSSWSTLLLSKIAPAWAGPPEEIFEAKNAASVFDAASSSVSGDGHTAALANQISFSGMASGMSMTAVTVDCDEKMVGDQEFATGSQETHVSEIARPWGTPGCYSADIQCRCAFTRARRGATRPRFTALYTLHVQD
jgi:hypothetical protein